MTSLFQESNRPTGEESESFCSRLSPITQQMENLQIVPSHRPSVLYSLLTGKARKACAKLVLTSINLDEMVEEIKKKVLYDGGIKDRRTSSWNTATFEQFRKVSDSEESATRKCLEFITEYQRDIPKHMLAQEHLYTRIRSIFRTVPWCETLFQRTEVHENPTSFGQKLISAAANHDIRASLRGVSAH